MIKAKKLKNYMFFANCKFVKGYTRSAIYDLGRQKLYYVPSEMGKIILLIQRHCEINVDELQEAEKEYILFLEQNEIIVNISKTFSENFPAISEEYSSPFLIHTIHIDANQLGSNSHKLSKNLLIPFVYVKSNIVSQKDLFNIIKNNSESLLFKNAKLIFFSSKQKPFEKQYFDLFQNKAVFLNDINANKLSKKHLNVMFFNEALNYNPYLNSNLQLRENGALIFGGKSLGKVEDFETNLVLRIVEEANKNKLFKITKDKIDICKNCEHKLMCLDSRIPGQRNQDEWYHKEECDYNPYIAKWKVEEGFQPLADCGVVSNEKTFSIDHERVKAINTELWDE